MKVILPRWKVYLYSLWERIELYKAINSNQYRWNFNREEILLLRQMQSKYISKGVMRKLKAHRYEALLKSVLIDNITVATEKEINLLQRFIEPITKLKLEDLLMEMKQLVEFGKEVGLKEADSKKMDEKTLIREIITRLEPQQEYSKELVAFYNDLDDTYFDETEATETNVPATATAEAAAGESNSYSVDELVAGIEAITKLDELKEVLADGDIGPLFEGFDPSGYKLAPTLKKAMIEFLRTPKEPEVQNGGGDSEIAIAIETILKTENEDELVALFEELQEQYFSEVNVDKIESVIPQLRDAMLAALGYSEEKKEEKPTGLAALKNKIKSTTATPATNGGEEDEFKWYDDPELSMEGKYEQVEKLGLPKLKKFAKAKLALSTKVGMKKDEILELIANKMQEIMEGGVSESTQGEATGLTLELVDKAAKAKDKEALAEMCDQLGIKLNALQKKSIPGMVKHLTEALEGKSTPETTPAETKGKIALRSKKGLQKKLSLKGKTDEAKSEGGDSVYQLMEKMVLEGSNEDAITKAVSPYYKEKGKSILFIKKRVKTMIQIIKIDNDLEAAE